MSTDDGGTPTFQNLDDEQLFERLRQVVERMDPVPPGAVRAGREVFAWRTVDAELAALIGDSRADLALAGAARGPEGPRLLSFETPTLTIEVQVAVVGERRNLVGQLIPPQPARLELRHRDGSVELDADGLGRFRAERIPAGPVSLRCDLTGAAGVAPVVTEWMVI